MSTQASSEDAPELALLRGGGEMGARMREFDWASTSLGPPKQWAQSLKTAVRIMLASRQPIWIGWGAELIYLYNDPYQAIIGEKHPDALGKPRKELRATATAPGHAAQLDLHHRNSLRLLKMVNGLVEFSRIEAGRIEAIYEPTDLAQYTAELASVFRSATERAGLRLTVDCQPLREPVYVGREMWEKIVLNLVGNALKFTFHGEIRETLNEESGRVVLAVADTGCGIPASELPKVQRFFLVRGVHSRTHEGTGIALALVQELARLHGGDARVESEEGRGSTFIVEIPTGDARISHRNAFTDAARSRRSPARMPLLRRRCGGFRCRRGRLPDQTFQRPGAIGAGRIAFASRKAAPGNRGARAGGQ